jgi:hypothetical protein
MGAAAAAGPGRLRAAAGRGDPRAHRDVPLGAARPREVAHHAWVSISIGCDNTCTFCIVPSLRGPEKSRKLGDIVAEARRSSPTASSRSACSARTSTPTGATSSARGRRPGTGSRNHCSPSCSTPSATSRGSSGSASPARTPRTSPPTCSRPCATSPNVCEQLHLPLQSGSDRILKAMQRSYRSRRFLDLVAEARETIPGVAISTDIIVGFPGETEEDFADTLAVTEPRRSTRRSRSSTPSGRAPPPRPSTATSTRRRSTPATGASPSSPAICPPPATAGRSARCRSCSSRGRARPTRRGCPGARARTASCTCRRRGGEAGGARERQARRGGVALPARRADRRPLRPAVPTPAPAAAGLAAP